MIDPPFRIGDRETGVIINETEKRYHAGKVLGPDGARPAYLTITASESGRLRWATAAVVRAAAFSLKREAPGRHYCRERDQYGRWAFICARVGVWATLMVRRHGAKEEGAGACKADLKVPVI